MISPSLSYALCNIISISIFNFHNERAAPRMQSSGNAAFHFESCFFSVSEKFVCFSKLFSFPLSKYMDPVCHAFFYLLLEPTHRRLSLVHVLSFNLASFFLIQVDFLCWLSINEWIRISEWKRRLGRGCFRVLWAVGSCCNSSSLRTLLNTFFSMLRTFACFFLPHWYFVSSVC